MSKNETMPNIALGAWSWGAGAAGGDQVFGNHLFEEELKPVFEAAMEKGLNLWDTAAVYGEGTSERILGNFVKETARGDVILSCKPDPGCHGMGSCKGNSANHRGDKGKPGGRSGRSSTD